MPSVAMTIQIKGNSHKVEITVGEERPLSGGNRKPRLVRMVTMRLHDPELRYFPLWYRLGPAALHRNSSWRCTRDGEWVSLTAYLREGSTLMLHGYRGDLRLPLATWKMVEGELQLQPER